MTSFVFKVYRSFILIVLKMEKKHLKLVFELVKAIAYALAGYFGLGYLG